MEISSSKCSEDKKSVISCSDTTLLVVKTLVESRLILNQIFIKILNNYKNTLYQSNFNNMYSKEYFEAQTQSVNPKFLSNNSINVSEKMASNSQNRNDVFNEQVQGVELEETQFTQEENNDKKFVKCDLCKFKFADKDSLVRHVRLTHTSETRKAAAEKKSGVPVEAEKTKAEGRAEKADKKGAKKGPVKTVGKAGTITALLAEQKKRKSMNRSLNNDSVDDGTPLKKKNTKKSPEGKSSKVTTVAQVHRDASMRAPPPTPVTDSNDEVAEGDCGRVGSQILAGNLGASAPTSTMKPGDVKKRLEQYKEVEDIFGGSSEEDNTVIHVVSPGGDDKETIKKLEKRLGQMMSRHDEVVSENLALHQLKDQMRDQVQQLEIALNRALQGEIPTTQRHDQLVQVDIDNIGVSVAGPSRVAAVAGVCRKESHLNVTAKVDDLKKANSDLAEGIAAMAGSTEMLNNMMRKQENTKKLLLARVPCTDRACDGFCGKKHEDLKSGIVCYYFNTNRGCFKKDKCRDLHVADDRVKLGSGSIQAGADGGAGPSGAGPSGAGPSGFGSVSSVVVSRNVNQLAEAGIGARGVNQEPVRAGAGRGRSRNRVRRANNINNANNNDGNAPQTNRGRSKFFRGRARARGNVGNAQGRGRGAGQGPVNSAPVNLPQMRVERSEEELDMLPVMQGGTLSQRQRIQDLREAARGEQGDQIKDVLQRFVAQNAELAQSLERMHQI